MTLTRITSDGITDAAIVNADINASAAIAGSKLADGGITTAKIADDAITNAKIANNAINTNELVNSAITTVKVADNAITTAKIADSQINNAKVGASAAIAGTKISPDFGSQNIATTGNASIGGTNLNMATAYIDFSGSISTPSTAAAIYRPADNQLAFSTANAERVKISNSGLDVTGNITATDDLTLTGSNKKFISTSSSSGDYIRLYAASGTGKWDIYGNGANLRFSDNDSAGSIVFDRNVDANGGIDVVGNIAVSGTVDGVDIAALSTSNAAKTTISNNADNRVITGGSGTNLNGESNLTFDGTSMVIGGGSAANVLDLGTATGNKGISWGGASYNYTNIWAEYGSGSLWLGAGLKSKTTNSGFFSSYGSSSFARSAIELESFSGEGIKFFTSGAQTVATDGAITVDERLRLSNDGHLSLRNAGNSHQEIQWYSGTSLSASIGWGNGSANWEFKHYRGDSQAGAPYANIDFFTGSSSSPTRALRITEDGMLLLGETNDDGMSSYDLGMKNGRVIRHRNAAGNGWINTFGLDSSNNIKIGWGGSPNEIHFGISGIGEVAKFNTSGAFKPTSNDAYDLGTSSDRWRNVYTNDLNLSNEGGANDVDGTWGSYTIQEGAEDLFLVNKRNGKKYKFNLTEVS